MSKPSGPTVRFILKESTESAHLQGVGEVFHSLGAITAETQSPPMCM